MIAFSELYFADQMGGKWERQWKVFGAPPDKPIDLCNHDHPITSKVTTSAIGSDHGFPFSIGPFEAQGLTCSYEGDEDKLGTLVCDGIRRECTAIEDVDDFCGIATNPNMTPVVSCQF